MEKWEGLRTEYKKLDCDAVKTADEAVMKKGDRLSSCRGSCGVS